MHYQQIIVGQGLAGSLLAHQLIKLNQQVLVIDNGNVHSSSRIAAGMFTPISGKRMVKSWMVDTLYPEVIATYKELENLLDVQFLNDINIQMSFASIKEQNDFYSALNDKINKYVTVPYEDMQWSANEETVFDKIKQVNEDKKSIVVEHMDGSTSEITPQMAKQMMELHKKINEANKAKMLDMLEASAKHFQTIAKFSKE